MIVEILPEVIGIPGRAGIAAMRMAGPKGQPQPAPERVAIEEQNPERLQHGRIGAAIIHGAIVPGIEMPREQDELLRLLLAIHLGNERGYLPPAGIHPRHQVHLDGLQALEHVA